MHQAAQGLLASRYPPASSLTLLWRPSPQGDRNSAWIDEIVQSLVGRRSSVVRRRYSSPMRRFLLSILAFGLLASACTPSESEPATTTTQATMALTSTTTSTATVAVEPLDPNGFFLNLIWHQHQPLYPSDANGVVTRPWVRLHATKDYYDMAVLVGEYPDLRVTFNLTPVLLIQLEDIVNGARDSYWVHTEIPASELSKTERQFIIDRFFDINPKIIERFARYQELRDIRDASGVFTDEDITDLQVLFNLAWTDPGFIEEEPLQALVAKGTGFDDADKETVLGKHLEIVSDVVGIHRELWDNGNIEVSTTPLAHPILPLIGDTDQALVGDPSAIMPENPFREVPDAVEQVTSGLDEAERILGRRPEGMWPAEGAVSQTVTPIFAGNGVTWVATGEDVLGMTLGIGSFTRDSTGTVEDAGVLYRPYAAQHSRQPQLPMFFRDNELADLIGFEYSGMSGGAAADDFMNRLHSIRDRLEADGVTGPKVVTIVVDGENAWEHYDNDGKDFLNALYTNLSEVDWVTTATPSELITAFPESLEPLPDVFPASWFQPNFATWIGEVQEARAWDYLVEVRDDLKKAEHGGVDEVAYADALTSMMFAEGSDWFWWYGSDQDSGDDGYFDDAFRELIGLVYDDLSQPRPGYVRVPIVPDHETEPDRSPDGLITIEVNQLDAPGWEAAGLFDGQYPLRWAFDEENLYLSVSGLSGETADIYLGVPSAASSRGLSIGVPTEAAQQVLGFEASNIMRVVGDGTVRGPIVPPPVNGSDAIAADLFADATTLPSSTDGDVVAVAVPLESLGAIGVGDRLSIRVIVDETGTPGFAPVDSRGAVQVPDISNVEILFSEVDVVGDDFGPGPYTYPTDSVFTPGSYDLTGFSVGLSGDELVFEFIAASPITNPWDSSVGLSTQTFDVYIDTDGVAGSGARMLVDGRNAAIMELGGWERALTVEGWEPALFTATSDDDVDETQPTMTTLVFGDEGRVVVRIARDLFPEGDPSTWGYAVAVMSQEGFPSAGVRRIRDVEPVAQQWRIGGGDGSINGTRIIDILWPVEGNQEAMLMPPVAITSGGIDDLTPEDFAQLGLNVSAP
jgi:alpha-amylase/alpha-mannosidase (GH57 family)